MTRSRNDPIPLAPQSVVTAVTIPLGRWLKAAGRRQVLARHVLVQRYAQPGPFRHSDKAFADDRLLDAVNQVVPPRNIYRVVLEHQEVLGGSRAVHVSHTR